MYSISPRSSRDPIADPFVVLMADFRYFAAICIATGTFAMASTACAAEYETESSGIVAASNVSTAESAAAASVDVSAGLLTRLSDRERLQRLADQENPLIVRSLEAMRSQAEAEMTVEVRPVTAGKETGKRVAPSGDPHDYVSLSPYWWPNPDTDDQLPYVRRDGEVNPDRHKYDTPKLGAFGKAVRTLGFAYHAFGDERYAKRAAEHARAWFVDPATRMRPRMQYAQFVPGVADGRPVGIIDTNRLRWVADAILMLEPSPHWTDADMEATRAWYGEYARWLVTSELGKKERAAKNNHGTWFAAQAMQYALMAGDDSLARELAESAKGLIAGQIEPDGSQPHELTRTRSLHYYEFNLRGLMDISLYAKHVGVDVAAYESPEGASIRQAIEHVAPYLLSPDTWEHQQIVPANQSMYYQTFRKAALLWDDARYEAAARALPVPREDYMWIDVVMPPRHEPTMSASEIEWSVAR
ncbi:MAG: alginate lyase family protein [Planctomycetota bacterium]